MPSAADFPMTNAHEDVHVLEEAAALNRQSPYLRGCTIHLPDYGQVVMTGDIHGHTRNLERIQKYADLATARARHVILHELIHAEPTELFATDESFKVLLQAARWKCEFPDQIHFMHSNHELSQLTGKEICKAGRVVTRDFERAMQDAYGPNAESVLRAIYLFIESFVLAVRTANRVLLSHSLPNARDLLGFDPTILDRPLTAHDYREGGHAYTMVWGRQHTPELLERLAGDFDVDYFICGHQPQETGYAVVHDRMIILASDHNHGVFLPFDLKKKFVIEDLTNLIRPLASIA